MSTKGVMKWEPENPEFWESTGKKVANRNLWISIPALLLAFSIWSIWSVVAVNLNKVGFQFTADELFSLAALPGLSGATLRILYAFVVPIFGGRNWTVFSTATLLIPAIWIGFAVQDPSTSYETMALLAILCGFGGGNFASSMANISFFFPQAKKGSALGLNAGLGNLGVSVAQFLVPIVIGISVFGNIAGGPQTSDATQLWLQNAGFIWVIPILLTTIAAMFGMNNLPMKQSITDQLVIFKRKHMWICSFLYTMSFGSFIGFATAFPLLTQHQFPDVNPLQYAFIGPLLGALVRPIGGMLADKLGGARVTLYNVILLIAATAGVIYFMNAKEFWAFFACFIVIFFTTGICNGSVTRMMPTIFPPKEAAPVIGFTSAIAAYGQFFIPKSFSMSIKATGAPDIALYGFLVFYAVALILLWYFYARKNAEVKC
ncbi:NarK family nitrate/nitrite MFS transporter [Brevibacillus laterosporus]|uniref:Nitrate/nitrite transporter n=1 Tax=Brevibacillus laterosporus LMG 15441 TaxID=1042163 RepID=A0A075R755_BRELA|nr:NarK family nitrate/nitrite MFS transporter [Brevibacillus laterosporus]AIG27033.1 nitrite facilitator 1 [Brevibacillus laterosporus LMG 15441]RJL14703.1 NarK family nitrate/nitrite MFS transporter [Brevibacillus laterosporus]TPH09486.1 NarK family nitrate/nitrite MFS transporter [Brevibacillus laterosporus]